MTVLTKGESIIGLTRLVIPGLFRNVGRDEMAQYDFLSCFLNSGRYKVVGLS